EKAEIAFLACPNNPTGNLWPDATIRKIADNFQGLLVIDEAYGPFADRSHVSLIRPNVMILRTFSKLGWAGLRLGYLLGEADAIAHLNKVRLPYNINSLSQCSAAFLFEHFEIFEKQAADIRAERGRVTAALLGIQGVEVFPSQTNFILIRVARAQKVFDQLLDAGILIKNMHSAGGLLSQCLRITIGTPAENDAVLTTMREIMS
ncbi:MAG: aminotransferase class I/II-fold pyridoxal phosphate-dependent enzyme, partial [Mariprofundaceae bacterium]